ncbi:MFS transporter [Sphingomonas sp.]|uniref:MFS transporter n=1 Tax=Sphingomonas sp. TaxID=28214 RepID=UPI002ED9CE5D
MMKMSRAKGRTAGLFGWRASRHDDRLLLLLAVANAGGVIAYVPLLTLLLPAHMAELAGDDRIAWLSAATLAGAIAASLANVAFGWASDARWSRRGWAATGLCLTMLSYALVHRAASPQALVVAIVAFQIALNMLLAALTAWTAEAVPDRRKGLLGGLLAAGQPVGALAGVIATAPILTTGWMRLMAVCVLMLIAILPVLAFGARPRIQATAVAEPARSPPAARRRDFLLLWAARLLVQIAGVTVFGFLLYYLATLPAPPSDAGVARLSAIASILAFPVALRLGVVSDRMGRRRPFLVTAAAVAGAGLAMMGWTVDFAAQAVGFVVFACSAAVFLALHAAYAMELLPSPARRGRDLGILNLANTLPSVAAPLLTLWLVPHYGFAMLIRLLALAVLLAGVCVLLVRRDGVPLSARRAPPRGP